MKRYLRVWYKGGQEHQCVSVHGRGQVPTCESSKYRGRGQMKCIFVKALHIRAEHLCKIHMLQTVTLEEIWMKVL